jgi:hypothetical protein
MSEEKKHTIKTLDHRGNEILLKKPVNDSAMTDDERAEWHRQRNEEERKHHESA